ncbi:PA2169 family four-helix-bundle protein [uncultured Salinicola sp.]|uniref:PA2169 family four-helix-bundle protein n=1 Tax=uncultured Salinicola sp. TaxID=1193542 RepID=UPI00261D6A15|nr:PA2169 family four-helix-bundle protein [uncultured Salinicola sp.]|tara:strand:+ start:1513 stop:1950 length:438 start_codon:yes stop_codon:yes gene_type:complete
MDKDKEISTLNELIGHTLDSADGYQEGVKTQEEHRYGTYFSQMAEDRRKVVDRLQARVKELGGEAEDDSTILGGMHRQWTFIKAVSTKGDKALLDSIEDGEAYLRDRYDEALKLDLDPQTRVMVEEGRAHAVLGHEKATALKIAE